MSRPVALVALATGLLLAAPAPAATPTSVVRTPYPIQAFVHDGDRIGWASCRHLWVRDLPSAATARLSWRCSRSPQWRSTPVLAGRRLIWKQSEESPDGVWDGLATMTLDAPRARRLAEVSVRSHVTIAGDGGTLVYGDYVFNYLCPPGLTCPPWGEVRRVLGQRTVRVPGAPPAVALDVSAGRMALVPAPVYQKDAPVAPDSVELREAASGALLSRPSGIGDVREVALSATTIAVLVDEGAFQHIERYAVPSGRWIGATSPLAPHVQDLDAAGDRIVYRTGRSIWLLNATTGRIRLLWTTRSTPIGLSIEGRRIAWATNGGGAGRILKLTLPRLFRN